MTLKIQDGRQKANYENTKISLYHIRGRVIYDFRGFKVREIHFRCYLSNKPSLEPSKLKS